MTTTTDHKPTHYALAEVETLRASETGFAIHFLPCAGVNWAVGAAPSPNGVFWPDGSTLNPVSGEAPTLEQALVEMANAARAQGREDGASHVFFANCDIHLVEDQRSVEDLSYELHKAIGPFDLSFDATDPDPYNARWALTPGDPAKLNLTDGCDALGGMTAGEILREALDRAATA